jgi:flagellar assembly factor FliW
LRVITTRFGELEIEEEKVITLSDGMPGFRDRRFILLNPAKGGPFCWFQSLENPDLAFVVVDPAQFVPHYQVKLTREEHDKLLLGPHDEVVLLSVVTMSPDPKKITMNLQGPIVINPAQMTAMQVVMDGNYTTRQLLLAHREPIPAGKAEKAYHPQVSRFSSLYSSMGFAMACP